MHQQTQSITPHTRKIQGKLWQINGKPEKIYGKPRKIPGKPKENLRKTKENLWKTRENQRKTNGKTWKIKGKLWKIRGKSNPIPNLTDDLGPSPQKFIPTQLISNLEYPGSTQVDPRSTQGPEIDPASTQGQPWVDSGSMYRFPEEFEGRSPSRELQGGVGDSAYHDFHEFWAKEKKPKKN